MHLLMPLLLSAALFGIGIYGVLARRNAILILMSVELMLNASNISLIAFDIWLQDTLRTGQSLAVFIITIAAAEIGLGLAIVLMIYRQRRTIAIDDLVSLGEKLATRNTTRDTARDTTGYTTGQGTAR